MIQNRNLKDSLFGIRADIDIIKKWKMKNTNKIRLHSRGIHALIPEQVIPSSKEEAKFVKGYQSQNRPKKQPPECNDQIYLQFADE